MGQACGVTAAQRRVLVALTELEQESGGWPVPTRAIGGRVGLASTATVHGHLQALLRQGVIESSPHARGGYRVTRTGRT